MPADSVVEVPAVLGLHGVMGVAMGDLPPVAAELCNRQKIIVDLAVKAALEGDRRAAVQAIALDPMVDDLALAEKIVEDGLALNKAYLPAFA
jgi:alpha-galactosidase/6-phospho-beta-glucosidase family protein